jgi:CO dehydrogenase/acetyl-CoA synthase delta subunit
LQAKVKPAGQVMVLATDAPRVARATGFRRPPSAEERATALASARQALERQGVAAGEMKVVNLTATDVDGDGRAELFGSYAAGRNNLFQFLEPGPDGYRVVIERFNRADDSAPRQMDERLLDHADLDGDGVGEVVTIRGSAEGFDYAIYQKKDGRWRQVYEGGGSGS